MDDQPFDKLDSKFTRQHIAAVQQGCILFDMSIHDNVAMGVAATERSARDVSRAEVVEACRMAMIHDFIEGLPEGYETHLGTGGSALSGGQRQRLAIARARIRNPTVLILGEWHSPSIEEKLADAGQTRPPRPSMQRPGSPFSKA